MDKVMKIAIIGGGKRCKAFLEMFDARRFPKLCAEIVAVADPNPDAVGIRLAREKTILTTSDYKDFYSIRDLDLVIELTGKEELLRDFQKNKPSRVRVLESAISRLFGDILRLREEFLFTRRQVDLVEGIMNSLFISIRDWVLVMQPDHKLLDVNEAFLGHVRMPKEEVIGRLCHRIAFGSAIQCSGEGFHCPVARCLETGNIAHGILEGTGEAGSVRYHEITAVPLKAASGRIELVVECFRDITDELEQRVEQKVVSLKRDLMRLIHEEKMISLGKLAASTVHEINNPLSGIIALAKLMQQELQSGEPDAESRERFIYYLGLISTESARCSGILTDLLRFSRQSGGVRTTFQLNDLVEKAVHFVQYRLDTRNIKARTELDDSLPPMTGEQSQIQQCLLNLIFNAVDAMPRGGDLTLRTTWLPAASQNRIEVIDTGTGIPREILPRIFDPFFSTKSRDRGTGLGLSVVHGIVKEHGGSIYVKSQEGFGARFILKFPITGTDQWALPRDSGKKRLRGE
ncbi:MAG: PAS domain-containing protein [Desulfobacteraceae bacterium]|nr:PAS domain-containing protein [Desulfobacteraceae bacterium]